MFNLIIYSPRYGIIKMHLSQLFQSSYNGMSNGRKAINRSKHSIKINLPAVICYRSSQSFDFCQGKQIEVCLAGYQKPQDPHEYNLSQQKRSMMTPCCKIQLSNLLLTIHVSCLNY
ncbi:hypothetical protein EUGRSUZ_J03145 [Eucalyptus grandis]|uniref:Uncharacterized protein n=2 Tax=Eucalyptus grandis TaxID=71139 RepID=A0ACC3JAJ1_EUCGR|nr:hypothetical protein EUGRSUZ_J03145 [Eucalyptus grandis]